MIVQRPALEIAQARIALGPWSFCAQWPDAASHPDQLRDCGAWDNALVPGTVASSLRALGKWTLGQPLDTDAHDWWYHTTFAAPPNIAERTCVLCFDGLATLAEVWLNGRRILVSDNMFRMHRLNVSDALQDQNELVIVFRSLSKHLEQKRPRPRWKTNLVNHQQLRWCRTTLLGRMPGWTPPVAPVGPWRNIRLECASVAVADLHVTSRLDGSTGDVTLRAKVWSKAQMDRGILHVGDRQAPIAIEASLDGWLLTGQVSYPDAPLWWPHTHGSQPLVPCSLELETAGQRDRIDCGSIGFRRLEVEREPGFAIKVNGLPVYCRGACWTVADFAALDNPEQLERDLQLARAAGINMLRVGGTMTYESDRFYDLCDRLGILVWQDFQFANMDYPTSDLAFAHSVEVEATEQLKRLATHPCVAVYCGNSEVEQQAAMLGVPAEHWRSPWFGERLPALCADLHSGTAHVPSTPSGGTLPFHVGSGVAHYYGVGAYRRDLSDVRRANVKFTPECLGFANVPEPETVNAVFADGPVMPQHPRWKERVPRDHGAAWDFEDVRDHYLRQLFGVDPAQLRSFDPQRYLRLGRVVSGEMMARVFAEWRSRHSYNAGGLVWFFKDLWPGAGWGILDSFGLPKAAYYFLKRSWTSLHLGITDEGLDGLHLHVTNETAEGFKGFVEMLLLKNDRVIVARGESPCELAPRVRRTFESDALLGGFRDVTYAYRFGPPQHDIVVATLYDGRHEVVSEAFHFIEPREPALLTEVTVEAQAEPQGSGDFEVRLKSDRFLHSVSFDATGFLPDDNYFHLVPGRQKTVRLRRRAEGAKFKAYVEALNLGEPVRVAVK
jgi:beta-mannosidase